MLTLYTNVRTKAILTKKIYKHDEATMVVALLHDVAEKPKSLFQSNKKSYNIGNAHKDRGMLNFYRGDRNANTNHTK